ncbi:hypothetical protein LTR85_009540 [Meristemomyces frigidus]|nr:hypothetical protein LTR85_009540 [Meristemomyces frigidus]
MALLSLLSLLAIYATSSAAWGFKDYCYHYDYQYEATPNPMPVPSSISANRTSPANITISPNQGPSPAYPDQLHYILHRSDTCYDEAALSGTCGSLYTFEDDCALFGLGNYEFKICNGAEVFAIACNITSYHQYTYRVIGFNGFEESGCVGRDCLKHCKKPSSGNIVFSTASEPDALMVMTTKHKVHYHMQLRSRLERDGFLTYPALDSRVAETWCNAETIMKVSKDAVSRANVGFLGYRCGTNVVCSNPSPETMRKVRDILENDPSVEIGLSVGLPALFITLFIFWASWIKNCYCFLPRRRQHPQTDEEDAGRQVGNANDHNKPVAMENIRAAYNPQPEDGGERLPAYGVA